APLALAAVRSKSGEMGFYPFADFSPELAAVRWALASGARGEAFDLPYGHAGQDDGPEGQGGPAEDPGPAEDGGPAKAPGPAKPPALPALAQVLDRVDAEDVEALWEQLVESPAVGRPPEETRRAALLFGWLLRADDARRGRCEVGDLQREAHMR